MLVVSEGTESVEGKLLLSEREILMFEISNIDRRPTVSTRVSSYWSRMFKEWDIWLNKYADLE